MKYFGEDTWEFIQDDHFVQWVLFPDAANTARWEQWMADHPERVPVLEKARTMVQTLGKTVPHKVDRRLLDEIYASLDQYLDKEVPSPAPTTARIASLRKWWWAAAAVIAGGIAMVSISRKSATKENLLADKLQSHMEQQQLVRVNTSTTDQVAWLTDGSSVILKTGATIKHDAFLTQSKREVYLKGNAFFDIAKDAERPFYVYTPKVAIRVLGTSFNVSEESGSLTVTVKTGKIAVCSMTDKQHSYIITPGHQLRFDARTAAFVADSLNSEQLAALQPAAEIPAFAFDNAPVLSIFKALESAYSIKINASEETFGKCLITTTIRNETFENKLKIICAAINASYAIRDGQVFITGKPCN
ncbi:DUF4974 domain-containing protein [Chitinophaga polysaccharea]|uniref:FecR family protein n=1 Tax=Chitinophaga TaxID=79328 RepID=UPI0014559B22|nr:MULTISPECIES: FecR family protein [Chitinophaga]NLR58287.1 DUF4974 domain-containing protein [Chitinophaga polysaccharea]NLU90813.1 DUF4974 domain-containing protein [Chitinophaga sp. Ak27]